MLMSSRGWDGATLDVVPWLGTSREVCVGISRPKMAVVVLVVVCGAALISTADKGSMIRASSIATGRVRRLGFPSLCQSRRGVGRAFVLRACR